MKKQTTILLLSLALLLTSCGANGAAITDGTAVQTGSDTPQSSDVTEEVSDDLGKLDFEGDEFNILTRSQLVFFYPLNVEQETGDIFNDAIYNRNRSLEERFNFKFSEQYYSNANEPHNYMLAGDDSYDMYTGRCTFMYNFAAEGLLIRADDIPNVNLSKPYWDAKLYDNLSVNGEHYFAVGDFNITSYDFTHVLLFNKKILEEYSLGDIYEIVRDGKWTFDKFAEMGREVVSDLNGDSVMDENDQYGYSSLAKQVLPGFWIAADTLTISKDKNDQLVYTAPSDDKFIEVYQKIFQITWDDNIWHRVPRSVNREEEMDLFCEGKALFTDSSCFQISNIRQTDTEFGIIPYTKYDLNQEEYLSRIEGCELFGIPKINRKPEMAGAILEAMACESMKSVIPAYYDIALKVKFTRDNESAEMLDLAFKNRVFDFGDTVICEQLRDGVLLNAMAEDNRNAASLLVSAESAVNAKLTDFNGSFSTQK